MHAQVPGRVRVKLVDLYQNVPLKERLERDLSEVSYVKSANANTLTGNLVVVFAPSHALDDLLAELEHLAYAKSQTRRKSDRPESRRKRSAKSRKPSQASRSQDRAKGQRHPPEGQPWHVLSASEIASALDSSTSLGLSHARATESLARWGANLLEAGAARSNLSIFLEQFNSPPVAMLGVSAVVSILTGGLADAGVIVGVVLVNAGIGYFTEGSAEKTIAALAEDQPTATRVVREGKAVTIPSADLVPGDLLMLTPGAYVPADARLLQTNRLSLDESALTGESMPVGKTHRFIATVDTPLADRKNMVHMGTLVTGGSGRAMVVATGQHTEIGAIQALAGGARPPETPMQRQLAQMGGQLAALSAGICGVVFVLGVVRGQGWLAMLKSSISLAVAAVPEGLPAVATTTLALGIRAMGRRHVLVRHLPAVESLGAVQVFCLDKTGTLTLNRMSVVEIFAGSSQVTLVEGHFRIAGEIIKPTRRGDLRRMMEVVTLCSEARVSETHKLEGSPTENALLQMAIQGGVDLPSLHNRYPSVRTQHRAEGRHYMVTLHSTPKGGYLLAVKGSPSEVLALCNRHQQDHQILAMDEDKRSHIATVNERMAGNGLRVLGVAYGRLDQDEEATPSNLIWLGLVGMADPVRPGMQALMQKFHRAGIATVMITGDQSATAYSVGKGLGLSDGRPLEILDSSRLDKMDPEVLMSLVDKVDVFARVSPAHKLRIVQALQASGKVVAMTGDGINDAPALKAAEVGVAMGSAGTEVARSVADVVLEDDNLDTMVLAVRQGRTIYRNIRKTLRFLLSTNLSEIAVMLATVVSGSGQALSPMQLLWINLMTDIFPGLALAVEPPEPDVLDRPPRDPQEPIIRNQDFKRLGLESAVITGGALSAYGLSLLRYGLGPRASSNLFMTLIVAQLLHSLSCRSEDTTIFDTADRPGNPYLISALLGSLGVQGLAVVTPGLRSLLGLMRPTLTDLITIGAGAGIPLLINELNKATGKPDGTLGTAESLDFKPEHKSQPEPA